MMISDFGMRIWDLKKEVSIIVHSAIRNPHSTIELNPFYTSRATGVRQGGGGPAEGMS